VISWFQNKNSCFRIQLLFRYTEVSARAKGKFDRRALPPLLRWLGAVPLEFLRTALGEEAAYKFNPVVTHSLKAPGLKP
jgi:hypothetical protein